MKRRNLHLTSQQEKALEEIKKKTGIPVAVSIRKAIDNYLNTLKKRNTK